MIAIAKTVLPMATIVPNGGKMIATEIAIGVIEIEVVRVIEGIGRGTAIETGRGTEIETETGTGIGIEIVGGIEIEKSRIEADTTEIGIGLMSARTAKVGGRPETRRKISRGRDEGHAMIEMEVEARQKARARHDESQHREERISGIIWTRTRKTEIATPEARDNGVEAK